MKNIQPAAPSQLQSDLVAGGWKIWPGSGLENIIGDIWARREGEAWAYGFVATSRHLNRQGSVHGGILMTFADQCLGFVAWEATDRQRNVTVQMSTTFQGAARPSSFIEARAEATRVTKSLVFLRGSLSSDGEMLASMEGVWKRLRVEDHSLPET